MKKYQSRLTASVNTKGVLDVDTVKGCSSGMKAYPAGGCYDLCYAAKLATLYGYDFSESISREFATEQYNTRQILLSFVGEVGSVQIARLVRRHKLSWFRIGTMGDPCHNWDLTLDVCRWLIEFKKTPVIVTKHWVSLTDGQLDAFADCGVVFNTSISALDTSAEIKHRLKQFDRIKDHKTKSVLRIVSCGFGDTEFGREKSEIQERLFQIKPYIDNPLRIPATDQRVLSGDIIVEQRQDLLSVVSMSVAKDDAYTGHCDDCPDQCGLNL
tara:strand:- start:1575 stop:2384 length:810 start_codon:yes stop_codon:yes gene_type:complete